MRETEIVQRIAALAGPAGRNRTLITGIGDDAAIIRPRPEEDLVFTTDFVLQDRHFTLATHTAADIGHKALARSLSDLAAMGSEPVFCLISLALPAALGPAWVNRLYKSLLALAAKHRIVVAGGDLARFEKVAVDVMCCGCVPRGKALVRSAAKPSDRIYVTGKLGASANGLATRRGPNWRRHLRPEPRIRVGIALRKLGISACMDLSDGLSLDLTRLCDSSRVSADIGPDIPVAPGASLDEALHGGEDYELLFTAPPRIKVPRRIAGIGVTQIGCITRRRSDTIRFNGAPLPPQGFDHFA